MAEQEYSNPIFLQYHTAPVGVPTVYTCMVVSIMIMGKRKEIKSWGLICVPLILYSTFAFLGIVFIVLQLLILKWYQRRNENKVDIVKKIFSSHNVAALFILCILTGYLAGNILQPKLEAASMGLTLINYSNYKTLFVLFQL